MGKLKLRLTLGCWGAQPPEHLIGIAQEAERLGFDAIFTAESWGGVLRGAATVGSCIL
jgi:alkanesulfonate monooxygenase SsuD/methylene tetrahydromethanopterin reductase-like flavin-dependent oxidoreductase (luciferase family)